MRGNPPNRPRSIKRSLAPNLALLPNPLHTTPPMRTNRKDSAPKGGGGGEVVYDDGKEAVVVGHVDAVPAEEELDEGLELRLKH